MVDNGGSVRPGGRPPGTPRSGSRSAAEFLPGNADLPTLRRAVHQCQGCDLYKNATQAVFSAGEPTARMALVGEQPGDVEDRRGAPFVGPAGKLLDRALDEIGVDREDVYVTNAVKHFKFTQVGPGKRRIHSKPSAAEIDACRPWLVAELDLIDPDVIVALGATAGRSLLGPAFRVTKERGVLLPRPPLGAASVVRDDAYIVATIHPSAVLRADDRDAVYAGLVADLKVAAQALNP